MIQPSLAMELFATPIVAFDLPGMPNEELARELLAEEQRVPSVHRANVGGWHSAPDLSRRPGPYQALMQRIVEQVGAFVQVLAGDQPVPAYRWGVTSWAMVMREHHYVTLHDHGDAHWSIAYYVDAGDDAAPPSGRLAFIDPRRSAKPLPGIELFPTTFDLAPRTGMLVVFPGWLQHHVHAYRGKRPRICISANLTMSDPR